MVRCRRTTLPHVAALWLLACPVPAADGPQYTIQLLGSFSGTANAMAINAAGTVVLQAAAPAGSTSTMQSWVWQAGTLTQLPSLPSGGDVYASGINNHDQVVGYAVVSSTTGTTVLHAVLWTGPSWQATDLGTAGATDAVAMSIDDSGVVAGVGTYPAADGSGIVLDQVIEWPVGSTSGLKLPTTTPTVARSWGEVLSANAIGGSSIIVGYTSGGGPTAWNANAPSALGTFGLTDFAGGYAEVVNANAVIGCDVYGGATAATEHLFTWHGGAVTPLPSLPTGLSPGYGQGHCNLRGIDTAGDIVGDHYIPGQANDAALWTADGHVYDLNQQLSGSSPFQTLATAAGISDQGLIVGSGLVNGVVEAFLLTPVAGAGTTSAGSSGNGGGSATSSGSGGAIPASGGSSSGGCGLGAGLGLVLSLLAWRTCRPGRSTARAGTGTSRTALPTPAPPAVVGEGRSSTLAVGAVPPAHPRCPPRTILGRPSLADRPSSPGAFVRTARR